MNEFPPSEVSANAAGTLKQLHDTIDLVCADAARAELWATALSAFAQPVPDYDAGAQYGPEEAGELPHS